MIQYRLLEIEDKYWGVEIFECPINIILAAARLGYEYVTVENFRHYRNKESVKIEIVNENGKTITPSVAKFDIDFQIFKEEFIEMHPLWDSQGCYAVFHRLKSIKFKVTDLEAKKRYRALDNFQWNLEIAIPDSASDGWGQILSPDRELINKLIQVIEKE
jgi:hypothetical protein